MLGTMTQPTAAPPPPPQKKTSGLALTGFILSLIVCFPPLSLIGALLGIVALVRMGGRTDVGGKGLAIASIPIGATSIVFGGIMAAIAIPNFIAFQGRAKQSEAKANLMALYTGERAYAQEHSGFSTDMAALGFDPEHGNRYAYFLADSGPTERRDGSGTPAPAHPVIIGVDQTRHGHPAGYPTAAATHCPLTVTRADGGPPLTLGVSGTGPKAAFLALAAGNVDSDATVDCWSIASVDRRTAAGKTVLYGVPYNEQDDVHR